MRKSFLASLALLALSGCFLSPIEEPPAGRFEGVLHVIWIGEGSEISGDGNFIFVPDPNDPLVFYRTNPDATVTRIEPEMMYTDGGSIPRVATLFRGFSPWGYAPAYVIHDWLFVAANCNNAGSATPAEQAIDGMPFEESADIIHEAILALIESGRVRENDFAPSIITRSVSGRISRSIWEQTDHCDDRRVGQDLRNEILLRTPGQPRASDGIRTLGVEGGGQITINPANIVTTIRF